ncbi:MAG: NfeD family protein [Rhizobiaceae bacterium]
MFFEFVNTLGPWAWVIFGLVLLGVEILMPSTFLLWPGLSALIVGAFTLLFGAENPIWPWQAQLLVFLILSLVIAYFGRQYVSTKSMEESEQPNLNQRGVQLVGQRAVLTESIKNGQGRARVGDTTWIVRGSDMKAGQTVEVVGADGNALVVEKASA